MPQRERVARANLAALLRRRSPGPTGYRSPTDPAKILIERRTPAEVDTARNPRSFNDLTEPEQHLYGLQLAAYRAACALAAAGSENAQYGIPIPRELIVAHRLAASAWRLALWANRHAQHDPPAAFIERTT